MHPLAEEGNIPRNLERDFSIFRNFGAQTFCNYAFVIFEEILLILIYSHVCLFPSAFARTPVLVIISTMIVTKVNFYVPFVISIKIIIAQTKANHFTTANIFVVI